MMASVRLRVALADGRREDREVEVDMLAATVAIAARRADGVEILDVESVMMDGVELAGGEWWRGGGA